MPFEETVESRMDIMSVKPEGGVEISADLQYVAKAGAAEMFHKLKAPKTDYTIRLQPFAPDVQQQLDQAEAIQAEIRIIQQKRKDAGPYSNPYDDFQKLQDLQAALKTIPVEFQMTIKSHLDAKADEATIGMYFLENPDLMETDTRLSKDALLFFYSAVAVGRVHDPEYKRLYESGKAGQAQEYVYQQALELLAKTNYLPYQLKREERIRIDGLPIKMPSKPQ